ncbi:MAG: prolipoprotein diacylglyceryl transferase [Patescibacteria group bacterium]
MESEVVIAGITLRWYGIFVASGIVTAALISWRALRSIANSKLDWFWDLISVAVVTGLIGARAWHVWTDWHLYATDLLRAFAVWQGGLSILGGILGGSLGIYLVWRNKKEWREVSFLAILDSLALGAPVGQAIGRLGNWVNQEVYGFPTNLPWKIEIDPQYRLAGYENEVYYHPLFAYEAGLLLCFAGLAWLAVRKQWLQISSGNVALAYLGYYGVVRFLLEFVRIDKRILIGEIGLNQAIMGMLALGVFGYFVWQYLKQRQFSRE